MSLPSAHGFYSVALVVSQTAFSQSFASTERPPEKESRTNPLGTGFLADRPDCVVARATFNQELQLTCSPVALRSSSPLVGASPRKVYAAGSHATEL